MNAICSETFMFFFYIFCFPVFTKQEAERECEGAPLTVLDAAPCTAPLRNGKAEPVREAPPILKTKTDDCCRTPTRPKAVTFHNDLVTGMSPVAFTISVSNDDYCVLNSFAFLMSISPPS